MGLFSTTLKAELAKAISGGVPEIVVAVKLELPSGNVQVSDSGAGSTSRGGFENRLVSLGPIDRGVALESSDVTQIEIKAELADPDFTFGRETERYRRSLRRSPVTVRVTSKNVPDGDSFLALTALLAAWDEPDAPMKWGLTLRGDDKALIGECPDLLISTLEWPDADPAVLGVAVPLIYGPHSSLGLGGTGMLPAYLVDRTGFRYVACLGWIESIPGVWVGATKKTLTTHYTIERVTVNGIRFTLIDFLADAGGEVRFDATGYTDNAAGTSGTPISAPGEQISHFLANFIFNKYRAGDWFSAASVPIDATSFATIASFCTTFGLVGSFWIGGEQQEIKEVLATWAEGWGFKWFQTVDGKMALGTLDHRAPATIYPSDFIRGDEEELDESLQPTTLDRIVRTVEAQYVLRAADNKYAETLRVTDLDVEERTTDTLEMPGSRAGL